MSVAELDEPLSGGRGGWPAILSQLALLNLAITGLALGVWAGAFPRAFYDGFPGGGMRWVSIAGPYNEHFIRDFGDYNLALALVVIVALVRFTPTLVRTAAAATAVFAVPHFVYHLTHQAGLHGASLAMNLGVLAFGAVVLPPVAIWGVSRRSPDLRPSFTSRPPGGHEVASQRP